MLNFKDIVRYNPHWDNNLYEYKHNRDMLNSLIKELDFSHITAILGPRRVGKTVLMRQIITKLIENNQRRFNILYFSFDEQNTNLKQIIETWEKELNVDLFNQKSYLFLDEIQNLDRWAEELKIFHDLYEGKLKIFVSGSASLGINKGQESLAGRIIEFFVEPLNYNEYLRFSEKVDLNLFENYYEYLFRQLPKLAVGEEEVESYIKSIVKKIIYEDAKKYYAVENTQILESIFKIILANPGQMLNFIDMQNDLKINRNTLSRYLDVLEKSYLISKCYNYSNNFRKTQTKLKKYYPSFTSLIGYLGIIKPELGLIIETDVRQKLNAEYFHNIRGHEIDFILIKNNNVIGVEVKAKNNIYFKDIKYFLNSKIKLDKKVLVTLPNTKIHYDLKNIEIVHANKLFHFIV